MCGNEGGRAGQLQRKDYDVKVREEMVLLAV